MLEKKPLLVFFISVVVTGVLEYFSGYVLYGILGWTKCWDYNVEILNFGNIGGYVCLRSVLVFGISALLLMYVILPFFVKLSKKWNAKKFMIVSIIICSIFLVDEIYNLFPKFTSLPSAPDIYKTIGGKYIYFS